jgi:hypothetical protein
MAYDDMVRKVGDATFDGFNRPLTLHQAVNGMAGVYGIDPLKWTTSAGFPNNVTKDKLSTITNDGTRVLHDVVLRQIEKERACLARGERVYSVFKGSLKDEAILQSKDKVRIINAIDLSLLVLMRQYFLPVARHIMLNRLLYECAVGSNFGDMDWTELAEHMTKYGKERTIAGDYKAYDQTMPANVTSTAWRFLIHIAERMGYDEGALRIMHSIATECVYPVYELNGQIIEAVGSNPSGHAMTVFINNVANALYMRVAYYTIYPDIQVDFADNVALMCYGDDNRQSVSDRVPKYTHQAIAKVLQDNGVVYTLADKSTESVDYVDADDATFLKRKCVWFGETGSFLAPIEEASIYRSMLWTGALDDTMERHDASVLTNALREWFHYGKDVYNDRLVKVQRVIDVHNLGVETEEAQNLPTYEVALERYREALPKSQCYVGTKVSDLSDVLAKNRPQVLVTMQT